MRLRQRAGLGLNASNNSNRRQIGNRRAKMSDRTKGGQHHRGRTWRFLKADQMAERLPQMTWSWEVSGSMDARVSRIVDAEPEYSLDYESESRKNTKLQLKANRFCIITLAVASVLATTIGCGVKRGITANTWEFGPPLSPWPTLSSVACRQSASECQSLHRSR